MSFALLKQFSYQVDMCLHQMLLASEPQVGGEGCHGRIGAFQPRSKWWHKPANLLKDINSQPCWSRDQGHFLAIEPPMHMPLRVVAPTLKTIIDNIAAGIVSCEGFLYITLILKNYLHILLDLSTWLY
jgi:hypothetical protein